MAHPTAEQEGAAAAAYRQVHPLPPLLLRLRLRFSCASSSSSGVAGLLLLRLFALLAGGGPCGGDSSSSSSSAQSAKRRCQEGGGEAHVQLMIVALRGCVVCGLFWWGLWVVGCA